MHRSLRFRFLFWISIVLLLTLGGAAYFVYTAQLELLSKSLRSKVDAIGNFIALISPQPIYTYDVTTLDRYMRQISGDPDVRFAQIRSPQGRPMTTYLPPQTTPQQLEAWVARAVPADHPGAATKDPVTTFRFPIVHEGQRLGEVLVGLDRSHSLQASRQVVADLIIIFGAIVVLLGGLIFIIFKLNVLNPIGALRHGTQRIAGGDFTHQVPVQTYDELGQMAVCFNSMMDEINIDRSALIAANRRLEDEIRQRQLANQELTKLSLAVEQSPASVVITNLSGQIEYVNPKFCEVSGYRLDELLGRQIHLFGDSSEDPKAQAQIWEKLVQGDIWKGEFRNRRKNGHTYWESAVIAPIRNINGETTHYLAVKEDITERKAFEQRLLEQATHDQLTGLPNRFLAIDRLQQMLQQAHRRNLSIGVIYIDLDNFKTVNDSMGHAVGDDLLVQVSNRILGQLRSVDTLCRLGGDEFMALVPDLQQPVEDLKSILERIIASLQTPFDLNGREITITSSLGIALFPDDGETVGTLMSNADLAMYEAKHAGRNTFRFFTAEMNRRIHEKLALEMRLRHALEAGELYPVFQPVIRLADGALVGAETLLRWDSDELGQVSPAQFIPIAEQTGLIRPITEWLFDTILQHAGTWEHRPEQFWLAVNIPPTYFCDDSFKTTIDAVSRRATSIGIELCMEITENLFLQNTETAIVNFRHLDLLGVSSAMDDFGTGYSSLAYIKRFPLDYLKIDRTFVAGLPEDTEDRLLTETIVLMGHRLGISLIAEGVETQAQLDYLRSLDVEYAQGYHLAEPMDHQAFALYLDGPARWIGRQ